MIVLDTHIWVWWVHGDDKLSPAHKAYIQAHETDGLGISAISCWEVAKLVEYGRLSLPVPVGEWLDQALAYPGMRLLELTPQIAVESTQLPGSFPSRPGRSNHRGNRAYLYCPLVTIDGKILAYQPCTGSPRSDDCQQLEQERRYDIMRGVDQTRTEQRRAGLVFATDSRLRMGEAWDMGLKLLNLGRSDCLLCFAGDTQRAYPLILQGSNSRQFNVDWADPRLISTTC